MGDGGEVLSTGVTPEETVVAMDPIARLTDIPFPTDFASKIPALSLVDSTLRQVVYKWRAAKSTMYLNTKPQ